MKKYLLITLSFFTICSSFSQFQPENPLTHEMTDEEREKAHLIGRNFYPTDPPIAPVRMVAEFEHMQSVLIRYPFGIPMTLVKEMSEDCKVLTIVASSGQQQTVTQMYQSAGVNLNNCEWLFAQSDSYWTRDYGPWFVVNGYNDVGVSNFPYNRPRPNDNDIPIEVADYLGVELYGMPLIHTGGNWMCDGWNVGASTDLVWDENPSLSHDSINALVESYLGIEKYHVLPDPLGDYIKHIDCWGKFLDVDKVLIGKVPPYDPRYSDFEYVANYFGFRMSSYGVPYKVYRVMTPGGNPATPYTNSLILNKKVFVPQTNSQWDDEALEAYEEAMPGYEIIGIYHNNWANTDALHCRAKGIADIGMLHIKHIPLLGNKSFRLDWEVSAEVVPYSGFGVKQDSILLFYMVDSSNYEAVQMTRKQGYTYSATIPFQEPQSEIAYYIHAADYSGRRMEHPYIGQPDPHVFTVNYATDAVTSIDSLEFTTIEEMLDGLTFDIYNFTSGDLILEDIENEGVNQFYWYLDPLPPATPHTMAYGDTLTIRVRIGIPVDGGLITWARDTLDFQTENGQHQVIIKVDQDLISSNREYYLSGNFGASVYPNPVRDQSTIELFLKEDSRVRIDLLSLNGQVLSTLIEADLPEGTHRRVWGSDVTKGVYLMRFIVGYEARMVKVVVL